MSQQQDDNQEAVAPPDDSEVQKPFHIVGVGASAGGLEALENFFSRMPLDTGMAFVVVQHLSPDFKSLMDQLLARKTSIPVDMIRDGAPVQPNRIYLLPPKKEAILSNGELLLAERPSDEQLSFPIDHFFRSLARDAQERSIGVILSGTGSDGSRGVVDIHSAGGLVIAQNENSAKFDGMPRSACETGVVDMVLTPSEIALALQRYAKSHKTAQRSLNHDDYKGGVDSPMAVILGRLCQAYDLDFTNYKTATISRRIERRLVLSGTADLSEYAKLINGDDDELDRLYQDLLIGVTSFFRDQEVFDFLQREVIPTLVEKLAIDEELRVWVPACATGEEAYSIAILISEYLDRTGDRRQVRVFASDVHPKSLSVGSRGVYQLDNLAGVSPERLHKYFIERSDGFHVSPELHKTVVFTPHDVLRNAPFTKLDFVSCRNLLIYLTPAAQRKVLSLFHFGLKRGGVLCLGGSESTATMDGEFEAIDERAKLFLKQRDKRLPVEARSPVVSPVQLVAPRVDQPKLSSSVSARSLISTYDRLLDAFIPPSVMISRQRELLHSFAGATSFFRHRDGRPTNQIDELLLPELRSPVMAALRRLDDGENAVAYDGVQYQARGGIESVKLTAWVIDPSSEHSEILLQFESSELKPLPYKATPIDASQRSSDEFETLERELQTTKDNLQSTIEELRCTNEELQTANEQLTSSNEELQSTNEELHSVNEELYTVNAEHQRKIDQLTELTDDMDNLLNCTNIHTVFLDRDMRLRRFTPDVAGTFSLIPQDTGRRFDNFTHQLKNKSLCDELEQVLNTSLPLEKEVQDKEGTWFLQRIRPYITRGEIDGVVLTLIDITSLKIAESKLIELSEIVEQSDDAIYRVDLDGRIRTWNRGALKLYGYQPSEVIGKNVGILAPEDLKTEPFLYLDRIRNGIAIDHVETTRLRSSGSFLDVSLTVSPLWDANKNIVGASVVARDVTKQKQAESEIREAVRQRDQFLAMLSHELRNPLSAIVNASNLLREEEIDAAAQAEAREIADTQVQHLARLLDDLLDVARITNDKLTLQLEVVDLKRAMMDALECIQHQIDEKEQQLFVETPNQSVLVKADVGRLQQAQVNLLINASKYSPRQSKVYFTLTCDQNDAELIVQDEGEPIAESLAGKIFQPFVQADNTLDRSQGGMGLGLPLVAMIAEAHGGTATLSANSGRSGNEFRLRIPLTREQKVPSKANLAEISLSGKRLLLIEDNDAIRNMLAKCLELKGFEVVSASDGAIGLEMLEEFAPEIAVVDIGLPDINGYEVAERIRGNQAIRQPTLVAVTGYGRKEDVERALQVGFDTHLIKPVDPSRLVECLNEIHDRRNNEPEKSPQA